ncbi:hypothetical protein ACFVYA_31815 [Amycolatopsis sp. NPDC058278]|uniref:hypothetical protein n=1 Tax=Amycolatopsis sp. NPDC058278 TaxID=3346417 RepID=UPI0036DE792A
MPTSSAQAWVGGGSPTKGFLGHVQVGPLQSTLRDWAATGWADGLFMLALLGIGLALLLGVGMRPEGGLLGVVTEADLLCRQAHQDDVLSVIEVLAVTVFRRGRPVPRC